MATSNKVPMTYKGAEYVIRYIGKVGGTFRAIIHRAEDTSRAYVIAEARTQDALTLSVIHAKLDTRL